MQIVPDHEAKAHSDNDARSPSEKISQAPLAHVRGSPVRHQAAEHIAGRQASEVSVVVRTAGDQTEDGNINQPANQRAPQSLSGHALPSRRSRKKNADKAQQRS